MKRALAFALVGVMAFSAVAFAGWKFGAEQGVDVGGGSFPFSAYVGYDFSAPFIDMGPLSIAGDFVATRNYDWVGSVLSGLLALDAELTFSYLSDIDVVLSLGGVIDYAPLPNAINLISGGSGVELIGYVNDVLTLNAGLVLGYVANLPGPGIVPGFNTSFFVGFDAAW